MKKSHLTPHIGYEPDDKEQRAALDHLYGEMKGVKPDKRKPPKKERKPVDHKSKGKPGRRSPVIDYVRSLDEDYCTTHEVAAILGVSDNLVRKLAKDKVTQAPSFVAPFGKTHVNLYTKEDISALKHHLKNRHKVMTREQFEKKEQRDGG
jgi:hypothetical protein